MNKQHGLSEAIAASKANKLIAGLPSKERQQFLLLCEHVDLVFGAVLCEAGALLQHAYFPLSSQISLSAITNDHQPLGMALIGNEGALGASLAVGNHTARARSLVHGSGLALRLTAEQLRRVLSDNQRLKSSLISFSDALTGQFLQTAACNSFHEVEMRLARWLLMTDDRSSARPLRLTHQFLADLLGVQRSAVTIAAGKLQTRKIIGYSRGHISILSRNGLKNASCGCYAALH